METNNEIATISKDNIAKPIRKVSATSKVEVNNKELLASSDAIVTDTNDIVDFNFNIYYDDTGDLIMPLKVKVCFVEEEGYDRKERIQYKVDDSTNTLTIIIYNTGRIFDAKNVYNLCKIIDNDDMEFYIQPILYVHNVAFTTFKQITINLYVEYK
jgi:hypothetical protein